MSTLRKLKQEQLIGLIVVLLLHGAGLYGLWSYHIIPTPDEAVTLMVNFINPPAPEPPKPPEPEPPKPRPIEPPTPQQLVVQVPVVLPNEPVAPPPPPEPVVVAPPAPPQVTLPVEQVLANELSVMCTNRTAPYYPLAAKRLNEQGKVVLRVELSEDGKVSNATVKSTSGFARLDEAALAAIKTWRCKLPVRKDVTARAVALQPFNFSLSE